MNKKKNLIIASIILILLLVIIIGNLNKRKKEDDNSFNILTSFYPVYVMALNITDGAQNITLTNMTENHIGCIHDYTLSTTDLRKFEETDVFIENGRDLEKFTENIKELYPYVKIVETAKEITNIIKDEEELNPHVWLSIDNYIMQVEEIANNLSNLNEENKDKYLQNSKDYIEKLNNLKEEFNVIKEKTNKRAICLNEAFEYLLKDLNIEGESIHTDHEQSALSAENIKLIIDIIKQENIKVIFVDKEDDLGLADTLSNETGAKIYMLNSGMNGNNSKDDYLNIMRENLETLKNIEF